jgi:hypothetical protein
MKKHIILSVNDNPDYLFHVPLTVWAWRKLGWEPILFYNRKGEQRNFALTNIEILVHTTANIKSYLAENIEGYRSDTITQISRLYGVTACYGVPLEEVYAMTGDIDMLPLSDYWQPDFNKLTVWGRDLTDYHYPICYIGAPGPTWCEIMDIVTDDCNYHIKRDLRHQPNMWVLDQDIITERINNSGFIPFRKDRGTDKRTGYPIGRIDRSHWTLEHKEYIDCHMFHGIQNDESKFKKTLEMLHHVWPKEDWSWWINFYKEFKKLMK